jgi:hypothetical protein
VEAEISNMSPEDLRKSLVEIRTKQRVAQKKYHNPEKAKAYQKRRNAQVTKMAELAKGMPATVPGYANLYEQIQAEAKAAADEKLGVAEAETETVEV